MLERCAVVVSFVALAAPVAPWSPTRFDTDALLRHENGEPFSDWLE